VIEGWFSRWPHANLGMVTGDGLLAIDIDPDRGGVAAYNSLSRGKLPYTAVSQTGSEGFHFLFRVDPSIRIGNRVNFRNGVDIRGEGGFIVVPPSVHPDTGQPYRWIHHPEDGIARAPKWLIGALTQGTRHSTSTEPASCDPAIVPRQDLAFDRRADVDGLFRDILRRFPVDGHGQRNGRMVQAAGSLLGRGFELGLVEEALLRWWEAQFQAGKIRTHPAEAPRAIRACVRAITSSPTFAQRSRRDHLKVCDGISLNASQLTLVGGGVIKGNTLGLSPPISNRVTPLCGTLMERAFVEALLVYFTYKVLYLKESPCKATRADLRHIMRERHGVQPDNQQFERLKRKFITRPGLPASRYELAVQTLQGRQGVPSEYALTGLQGLIEASEPQPATTGGTTLAGVGFAQAHLVDPVAGWSQPPGEVVDGTFA
jgi:hypothetical protein